MRRRARSAWRGRPAAWAAVVLLAAPLTAAAAGGMTLERAWARATPPGTPVAAVYLVIDNRGSRSDRLLAVSSPRAARAELHATVHEGDLVRMRRVDPLHVGARERLVLEPGGMHVMLFGLSSPLVAGERVPLLLRFEVAGELEAEIRVFAAGAAADRSGHDHH